MIAIKIKCVLVEIISDKLMSDSPTYISVHMFLQMHFMVDNHNPPDIECDTFTSAVEV